jgi:MarR family transcriptional regulator, organic hydroperoxide resistance regulator
MPTLATPEATRLGPVLAFMSLLWAADHGLDRLSKRMEAKIGVTGPQRLAIRIIGRFPWISAGQLAAILHVHPSTLTGILRRLEARRLLLRRIDARDARRALLRLTSEGKRCDARQAGTIEAIVETVLAQCTRHEIDVTARVLARLAAALDVASKS